MWINHQTEQEKKLKAEEPKSVMGESTYQADSMYDDNNSKDFGRRSIAIDRHSITHIDRGNADGSFKLRKMDHHKFNNMNYESSGCCSSSYTKCCSDPE